MFQVEAEDVRFRSLGLTCSLFDGCVIFASGSGLRVRLNFERLGRYPINKVILLFFDSVRII